MECLVTLYHCQHAFWQLSSLVLLSQLHTGLLLYAFSSPPPVLAGQGDLKYTSHIKFLMFYLEILKIK